MSVMMALMNNWDLKDTNNAVYAGPGDETHLAISDLGATLSLGSNGRPPFFNLYEMV